MDTKNDSGSTLVRLVEKAESSYISAFLIIIFIALNLSYQIPLKSVWEDEAFSAFVANSESLSVMNDIIKGDVHPPFYFFILKIWTGFFGATEWGLRSLSLLFGLLGAVGLYFCAKTIFSARAGFWAIFILGLSPFFTAQAVHARMYSMVFCFCACCFLWGGLCLKSPRFFYFISFVISCIALSYSQYTGILCAGGFTFAGLFLSWKEKTTPLRWFIGGCVSFSAIILLLPFLINQLDNPRSLNLIHLHSFSFWHFATMINLINPFAHKPDSIMEWGGALLICFLIASGFFRVVFPLNKMSWKPLWILVSFALILLFFVTASFISPIVNMRTLIIFMPFLAILAGCGVSGLPPVIRLVSGVLVFSLWVSIYGGLAQYKSHENYRQAAEYIQSNSDQTSMVVISNYFTHNKYLALDYYFKDFEDQKKYIPGDNFILSKTFISKDFSKNGPVPDIFFLDLTKYQEGTTLAWALKNGFVIYDKLDVEGISVYWLKKSLN